jgi:hypothetical protein
MNFKVQIIICNFNSCLEEFAEKMINKKKMYILTGSIGG